MVAYADTCTYTCITMYFNKKLIRYDTNIRSQLLINFQVNTIRNSRDDEINFHTNFNNANKCAISGKQTNKQVTDADCIVHTY